MKLHLPFTSHFLSSSFFCILTCAHRPFPISGHSGELSRWVTRLPSERELQRQRTSSWCALTTQPSQSITDIQLILSHSVSHHLHSSTEQWTTVSLQHYSVWHIKKEKLTDSGLKDRILSLSAVGRAGGGRSWRLTQKSSGTCWPLWAFVWVLEMSGVSTVYVKVTEEASDAFTVWLFSVTLLENENSFITLQIEYRRPVQIKDQTVRSEWLQHAHNMASLNATLCYSLVTIFGHLLCSCLVSTCSHVCWLQVRFQGLRSQHVLKCTEEEEHKRPKWILLQKFLNCLSQTLVYCIFLK